MCLIEYKHSIDYFICEIGKSVFFIHKYRYSHLKVTNVALKESLIRLIVRSTAYFHELISQS